MLNIVNNHFTSFMTIVCPSSGGWLETWQEVHCTQIASRVWGQKGVQPSTSKGYLVKCLVTICTKCIQLSAVVEWEPLKCVPYNLPCDTWDNECMEN